MFVVRLHIHEQSPLPSQQTLLWLAAGIAEDFAIAGLAAALLLALARIGRRDGWVRVVFGAFVVLLLATALVWSEVVIFFGQVPPREVLPAGMNFTFARGSASGPAMQRAAFLLLPVTFLLWVCARQARKARWVWSDTRRLLAAGLVAGIVAFLVPASIHRRETARNPLLAQVAIWRSRAESGPTGGSSVPTPRLDPSAIRRLAPRIPSREYLSDRFPLAHRAPRRSALAPRLPAGLRPNVVFLLLEGVRAEDVGAYGGQLPGLTPNLDRLAREGVLVERAYSAGQQTPDAELALWYGIHPNLYSSVMMSHPKTRLTGLPELLRASGWRTFLWIHNGDQHFYRRDGFYLPRGFRMVDGSDFPRDDPRTNWGYSDRALARRAVEALDRAREPFAALALTVSNHHPYQVPPDARSRFPGLPSPRGGFRSILGTGHQIGLHTVPMLQTVHYTDEAVGDFFRLASSRPWFQKTVFVVAGDHGLAVSPYGRSINTLATLVDLRHRIPMILFSPMLAPSRIRGPASQTDVPETLLGLAGVALQRAGTGRDLLDPAQFDPKHRIVGWSVAGGIATVVGSERTYHAVVDRTAHSGEPIRFSEEILFAPSVDRDGTKDLTVAEPETAEEFRRLARVYLDVYPWILLSGRSGVPSEAQPVGVTAGKH
jgi:hypothetical protein